MTIGFLNGWEESVFFFLPTVAFSRGEDDQLLIGWLFWGVFIQWDNE